MPVFLRALRMLAMVVWVGGLIFFAFVLAPLAFQILPSTHDAGVMVGGALRVLNPMGHASGLVFLVATALVWVRTEPRGRGLLTTQMILVVLMIAATAYVEARLLPAMERDRLAAGGIIDEAPLEDPARIDFNRLHGISEKVEGSALLLGLGVVVLMAAEPARLDK